MESAHDPSDTRDPFNLARFVAAQAPVIDRVHAELSRGRKQSHWMWFVFPQLAGLGKSPTAQAYALASLDEAKAYAAHPVLGARLRALTEIVLGAADGATARGIFGTPDDLKFHSCMTLFARAAPDGAPFHLALARFFDGREDGATLALLAA